MRFHWQAGDIAFWDNRATQHYAVDDYAPHRRIAERVAIAGDRPVLTPGRLVVLNSPVSARG